jgi:L-alanine-DL-glutamate epimerase-like enolase superfamily enzyme
MPSPHDTRPSDPIGRRGFLAGTAAAAVAAIATPARAAEPPGSGRLRIEGVTTTPTLHRYRTPYKFGGVPVDRATVLDVTIDVVGADGRRVTGFGSMPLGNVWSFPARDLPYDTTLGAMDSLADRIAKILRDCEAVAHPLELARLLEPEFERAAAEESRARNLAVPIPKLAVLVTASPFDAALHDACGKLLGRSSYRTLTPDCIGHDLSRYLGPDFTGVNLQTVLRDRPLDTIPLFHSVGGADPVLPSDATTAPDDGLPRTLADWIRTDGLTHLKIKLQGESLDWDIDRTLAVDRVARETRPDVAWNYCVDFNERCPNVAYALEFLAKVKEGSRACFESILYVEQPTARDLDAVPRNDMHAAAKLRPVVVDESLVDLESLLKARDLGYSGVALKACKGQSHAMLMAAAARHYQMFLTVQDLTCPGAALVHSAGIAAWVPGVAGLEANARQYMPEANRPWAERFPGLFRITDGRLHTGFLADAVGLGAVP